MTDTEEHIFTAKDGTEYSFSTEEEMKQFAIEYSIMSLVADGYGEYVEIDGEKCFRINDKGRAHLEKLKAEQEKN